MRNATNPVDLPTIRKNQRPLAKTKAILIQQGIVQHVSDTISIVPECGGLFSGDACSFAVSTIKVALGVVVSDLHIVSAIRIVSQIS